MARKIAAGNWKMNGLKADLAEIDSLAAAIADIESRPEVLICPPFTLLPLMHERAAGTGIAVGGQDCHPEPSGAHTGDIAAEMLADAGASHVILGHSERRSDHAEDDALVAAKARAAWRAELVAIICVGESEAERDAGRTLEVIGRQLAGSVPQGARPENTVIAYEPVWAIGTGRTPTTAEIAEVHAFMRERLVAAHGAAAADIPLLYGGSVKPGNAAEIFAVADVDGGLVGGASLRAADFVPIVAALAAS